MIQLDEHINQITTKFAKKISNYTVQLYYKIEKQVKFKPELEPIASAVILTLKNRYFFITAGHVLCDNDKNRIGIFEEGTFYKLINKGQHIFYINPEDSQDHKYFDIAIFELDTETVDIFKKYYSFLTINNISFRHISRTEFYYLIVGFPYRRTKYNPIKFKIKPILYKFLTKTVSEITYNNLKINPDVNFVVEYEQRKIKNMKTGTMGRSILLDGMSGCGLWHIPNPITEFEKDKEYYLVGIVFRHDDNKKYVISLKTDKILLILKEKFNLNLT